MKILTKPYLQTISVMILIITGIVACGCSRRPKGVLSDKKMVEVMTDLQLAEAYGYNQINGSNTTEERERLSLAVLEAHGVTKEQLDTTLGWYGRNMDVYEKLYEKVDKRLNDKRKKLVEGDRKLANKNEGDNLWQFGKNGQISSLGNSDGWRISIANPELSKGDRLEWSFHINSSSAPLVGVLGVDYEDGTSEALTTVFNNRKNIEFSFQTDTSKLVTRLFGTMRLKDTSDLPLFADSIALRRLPFDSIEYNKFRPQRKYGVPVRIQKTTEKDSIQPDTTLKILKNKIIEDPERKKSVERIGEAEKLKSKSVERPPIPKKLRSGNAVN